MQKSLKVLLQGKKVKASQTRLAELRDQMVIRMVSVLEYGFQHTKMKMQANAIAEMASPMSA